MAEKQTAGPMKLLVSRSGVIHLRSSRSRKPGSAGHRAIGGGHRIFRPPSDGQFITSFAASFGDGTFSASGRSLFLRPAETLAHSGDRSPRRARSLDQSEDSEQRPSG